MDKMHWFVLFLVFAGGCRDELDPRYVFGDLAEVLVDGGSGADAFSDLATDGSARGDLAEVLSCNDGAKNGLESDVDCGGKCPMCANGKACKQATDCMSGRCGQLMCMPGSSAYVHLTNAGNATALRCIMSGGNQSDRSVPPTNQWTLEENVLYCFFVTSANSYALGVMGSFDLGDGMAPRMLCMNHRGAQGQIGFDTDSGSPCQ